MESDSTNNRQAIYELVEQIQKSLPLHLYNVTQVELAATVFVAEGKPPKTVSFRITHPNSCSLKYDDLDLTLRQMLEDSGLEPKAPAESASQPAATVVAPVAAAA